MPMLLHPESIGWSGRLFAFFWMKNPNMYSRVDRYGHPDIASFSNLDVTSCPMYTFACPDVSLLDIECLLYFFTSTMISYHEVNLHTYKVIQVPSLH